MQKLCGPWGRAPGRRHSANRRLSARASEGAGQPSKGKKPFACVERRTRNGRGRALLSDSAPGPAHHSETWVTRPAVLPSVLPRRQDAVRIPQCSLAYENSHTPVHIHEQTERQRSVSSTQALNTSSMNENSLAGSYTTLRAEHSIFRVCRGGRSKWQDADDASLPLPSSLARSLALAGPPPCAPSSVSRAETSTCGRRSSGPQVLRLHLLDG